MSYAEQEARGAGGKRYRKRYEVNADGTLGAELEVTPYPASEQPAKVRIEVEMEDLFADWQRWKETRLEATARAMGSAVITPLQNRENAAWTAYMAAINRWRSA